MAAKWVLVSFRAKPYAERRRIGLLRMMMEITDEQRREVEALLHRRDVSPRQRERLEMVKAVGLGHDEAASPSGAGAPSARCGAG